MCSRALLTGQGSLPNATFHRLTPRSLGYWQAYQLSRDSHGPYCVSLAGPVRATASLLRSPPDDGRLDW